MRAPAAKTAQPSARNADALQLDRLADAGSRRRRSPGLGLGLLARAGSALPPTLRKYSPVQPHSL